MPQKKKKKTAKRKSPSIVTKRGDDGFTQFFGAKRIKKDSPFLEVCGTIDELTSLLGMARAHSKDRQLKSEVLNLQKELFAATAALIVPVNKAKRSPVNFGLKNIRTLEKKIKVLEKRLKIPHRFVIPGNSRVSALLDYSRALCRKLERRIVGLKTARQQPKKHVLIWFNRLSDYLYLLARQQEKNTPVV